VEFQATGVGKFEWLARTTKNILEAERCNQMATSR
jgi:hypothetical protein